MNRVELINEIVDKASVEVTKKQVDDVLKTFVNIVSNVLVDGDKVQLVGFGTFETVHKAARKGKNPQTGEELVIAERNVPKFKPGKALKDAVK
jgi:nucleoid DNA-binding protein